MTKEDKLLEWTLAQYNEREELWRPVVGFEGRYEVSSHGRVRGLTRNTRTIGGGFNRVVHARIMNPSIERAGKNLVYHRIKLCDGKGGGKRDSVSRLVAIAFLPNPNNLPCVDHICGTDGGDGVWNLRWCTYKENSNFELAKKHQSEAACGEKNSQYGKPGYWTGKRGSLHNGAKKVAQFTRDGIIINTFGSIADAHYETGVGRSSISRCCAGNPKYTTAGGFVWKYVD